MKDPFKIDSRGRIVYAVRDWSARKIPYGWVVLGLVTCYAELALRETEDEI